MNLAIIFAVALGCFVAERLWPAMKLPRVNAWWGRVVLINSIQFGITVLAGRTWNRWLNHFSLFDLKEHCGDWSSALIIYLFSTLYLLLVASISTRVAISLANPASDSSFGAPTRDCHQLLQTSRGDLDQFDPEQCDCVPFIRRQPSRSRLLHHPHSRW